MATIRPFCGIHYALRPDLELSRLIAPPYDVLDEAGKAALQARHPNNIVTIDLPHVPPKSVGPDEAYAKANTTLQAWLSAGVLVRDPRPAIYPYTQSYQYNGKTFHRRGFICTVKLEPLGAGHIVPHEKTYPGAIEDRLKLMRATRVQLSPVFGLFNDDRGEVTKLLYSQLGRPMLDGTLDGVRNQLWSVTDAQIHNEVIRMIGTKNIYIADGHHRYTTALQYQRELEQQHGGPLPPNHPANYCMFVLVNMNDDGLLILPTHRLIGGLDTFDIDAFKALIAPHFEVTQTTMTPPQLAESIASDAPHTFGLYDGRTRTCYKLRLKNPDILAGLEPQRSQAWRRLDVAILHRYLLDEVLQPTFAAGRELVKGYTADADQIASQVDGRTYQIALLLRPTPLHALEELGRHGELMPQKSTYFYPKLATGLIINPLT
ncbi:DUF1015 domain-containing protein [Fontivita pretiosa]|uniref:DUF1015 domain-containing protein n=1 Tax=Fontivita pretiosa TaxID=2989684 RepID=UPI003D17CD88